MENKQWDVCFEVKSCINKVLRTFKQKATSHTRTEVIKPNNLLFSFFKHL